MKINMGNLRSRNIESEPRYWYYYILLQCERSLKSNFFNSLFKFLKSLCKSCETTLHRKAAYSETTSLHIISNSFIVKFNKKKLKALHFQQKYKETFYITINKYVIIYEYIHARHAITPTINPDFMLLNSEGDTMLMIF